MPTASDVYVSSTFTERAYKRIVEHWQKHTDGMLRDVAMVRMGILPPEMPEGYTMAPVEVWLAAHPVQILGAQGEAPTSTTRYTGGLRIQAVGYSLTKPDSYLTVARTMDELARIVFEIEQRNWWGDLVPGAFGEQMPPGYMVGASCEVGALRYGDDFLNSTIMLCGFTRDISWTA